jgi:hypothetical protein
LRVQIDRHVGVVKQRDEAVAHLARCPPHRVQGTFRKARRTVSLSSSSPVATQKTSPLPRDSSYCQDLWIKIV